MIDKNLRRASWPAIESVFRSNNMGDRVDQYNKTKSRQYYVDGIEFSELRYKQQVHVHGLVYADRLILEPEASQEKWAQWCNESCPSILPGEFDGGWFLAFQGGGNIGTGQYFGENTIFQGREAEIYEFFFSKNISSKEPSRLFPVKDEDPIRTLLSLPECVSSVLCMMKLNPYYVSWRFSEQWYKDLGALPASRFTGFDRQKDTQWLARSMCLIEWAHRHPDRFDPIIKPIVELCRGFYTNSHSVVRQAYENTLEDKLSSWAEATGAGGQMTIGIEYDAPEYLQAILLLLDPTTRYPCKAEDPPGLVRALPLLKGRSYRVSYYLITSLWSAGFVVDDFKLINKKTLLLEVTLPLSREKLYPALSFLASDATDIDARIEARRNMPGDTLFEDEFYVANLVYLMKPCVGKRRVGAFRRGEAEGSRFVTEFVEGEKEVIDRLIDKETKEEQMVALLEQHKYILENASIPIGSKYGESIDGFEICYSDA